MIIFHEGLPGSGKSYEAVVKHIIPTIQQGRMVYAFVEGLNHDKISEVSGLPVDYVRDMLIVVEREQVPVIHDVVQDNSFVVIDEAQNFYPCGRVKLDDDLTKFVTEHRHRGIDILLMGQDIRDVNALWRRRVDQKVTFTKMDMLGLGSRYRWVLLKAMAGERFEEINRGMSKYDKRYFGTYSSHVNAEISTQMYQDSRSNLFKSTYFRLGLFVVVLFFCFGYYGYSSFFDTNRFKKKTTETVQSNSVSGSKSVPVNPQKPLPSRAVENDGDLIAGYVSKGYRPRLASYLQSADRVSIDVEFLDDSLRIQDRMSASILSILGWRVLVYGVLS